MVEKGDRITLGFEGSGLRLNNETVQLTLDRKTLEYLGTTFEKITQDKDRLILQFDYSDKHKWNFIGIGVKKD